MHKRTMQKCIERPDHYGCRIIGISDLWHEGAWVSSGCFDLCEDTCFLPCLQALGLSYRGQEKIFGNCFCIKHYAHYKRFLLDFVAGVTELLEEYFPASLLENTGEMWDTVLECHSGSMYVLYTSWIIALNYVEFIKAVQANDHAKIDNMMAPLFVILMSTGHFNVAEQMMANCFDDVTLLPQLLEVRRKHQCMTLTNRMAYDGLVLANEKLNLKVNKRMGGATGINFVQDLIQTFNATEPVEDKINEMFGQQTKHEDWMGPHEDNSAAVREYFRRKLTEVNTCTQQLLLS